MGRDFHRLVMAALAAGLLVIPGCGAGAGSGTNTSEGQGTTAPAAVQPKIVSAELDGTSSLKLTFSEAMQPSTGVDPTKFRLTVGYYAKPASATDKYTYTYYSGTYDYTRYDSNAADVAGILSESSASTEAVLLMGATFNVTTTCQQIAAHGASAGLYLHYSSQGTPTLEDTQGNVLPSVAAFWESPGTKPQAGASGPIPVSLHCN
jgi:hypothetical protein